MEILMTKATPKETSKNPEATSSRANSRGSRAAGHAPPNLELLNLQRKVQARGTMPVQLDAASGQTNTSANSMANIANQGFRGQPRSLPNLDRIQAAFGKHDVSHVRAYTDGNAQNAARTLRANGYTVGDQVALNTSSLHTEAHEAAHVVQQQSGVHLSGRVGKVGDKYERHADAVADAVVQGRSAESLLDAMAGNHASAAGDHSAIQFDVPKFGKEFDSTSIGAEVELGGIVCALPEGAAQAFAVVKLAATNEALVKITKDMSSTMYGHPGKQITQQMKNEKWLTYTIELVTYPCEKSNADGLAYRKQAVEFLLQHFTTHVKNNPHMPLEDMTSDDDVFTLEVANKKHIIAANLGAGLEDIPGTITAPAEGKQATVGIKASAFGTGADDDIKMLEDNAPWYHPEYANDDAIVALKPKTNLENGDVDDIGRVKRSYAYLKSIIENIAHLVHKYNLSIEGYDAVGASRANGLADPKVKNEWKVLPRTAPKHVLKGMTPRDRSAVLDLIYKLPGGDRNANLWKASINFVKSDYVAAGHAINDAKVGNEDAMLFEYRQLPDSLDKLLLPKIASSAVDDDEIAYIKSLAPSKRSTLTTNLKNFVADKKAAFKTWYVDQKPAEEQERFNNKSAAAIVKLAAPAQLLRWVKEKYPNSLAQVKGE